MSLLRIFLIGWLTVAVPVTATAAIVNADHCQRVQKTQQSPIAAAMDHSLHAMHGQQSADPQPMSHALHQDKQAQNGCSCGCNCFSQHCTTGFSGLMSGLSAVADFFDGISRLSLRAESGPLTSAHPLELLRPPSPS